MTQMMAHLFMQQQREMTDTQRQRTDREPIRMTVHDHECRHIDGSLRCAICEEPYGDDHAEDCPRAWRY